MKQYDELSGGIILPNGDVTAETIKEDKSFKKPSYWKKVNPYTDSALDIGKTYISYTEDGIVIIKSDYIEDGCLTHSIETAGNVTKDNLVSISKEEFDQLKTFVLEKIINSS